jgi:DNA-binding cell septation regulator SpoVG
MLTLDYILSNTDRHFNNFGFVRNSETLEWLGFSPIYDSGTSLWHNTRFVGRPAESKPFKRAHEAQLRLVSDLSWIDFSVLNGLKDEVRETFLQSEYIDVERGTAIADAIEKNVEVLKRCVTQQQKERYRFLPTERSVLSARLTYPTHGQSGKAFASVSIGENLLLRGLAIEGRRGDLCVTYPEVKDIHGERHPLIEFVKDGNGNLTESANALKNAIELTLKGMYKNGETERRPQLAPPADFTVKADVTLYGDLNSDIKGIATVQFDDVLKLNLITIKQSENGELELTVPRSPPAQGSTDFVVPITSSFKEKISNEVLRQYENEVGSINGKEKQPPQKNAPAAKKGDVAL